MIHFPEKFFWGAATSAYQVEGNNRNNWSKWEKEKAKELAKSAGNYWHVWQQNQFPEMFKETNYFSDKACCHYSRYEEDFEMAKNLGHNAHRFSLEWSRIEPKEGEFSGKELEHYKKVIESLRNKDIEPFVTLWHWTLPLWLSQKGGLTHKKFAKYFSRYVSEVVKYLGSSVKFWIILNEPTVVISNSYLKAKWPPQERSFRKARKVYSNLVKAHKLSYAIIHKKVKEAQVGISHMLSDYEPYNKNSFLDKKAVSIINYQGNQKILKNLKSHLDFIGVNYYFHNKIQFPIKNKNENKKVSDLGWEIYPEGIYHVLKSIKKYQKPIYITENGLADKEDKKRVQFIRDHLFWIHKALLEGVDIRGYFYWSLLDNFEWDKGFWPRFGLIEVNYENQERKIRESALEYAKIIKENGF